MARIGYARVSTLLDQTAEPQVIRLRESGCDRVYVDEGQSGSKSSRPEWDKCLASLQKGDTLVAIRLDRFGRSVAHLLKLSQDLQARGIDLQTLDQPIDTTTPVGKLLFVILAAVGEFERELIRERTRDGLANAVAKGVTLGADRILTPLQERSVRTMKDAGMRPGEIADALGVSLPTYYRTLRRLAEVPA